MPVIGFNHFNIRARSPLLEEVRDFYRDVVGLEDGYRPDFGFPGYWMYLNGQAILHLMDWHIEGEPATFENTHLDHVAFTCEDLTGFESKLAKLNINYRKNEFKMPDGSQLVQLNVSDPTGNGVELNFMLPANS